MSRALNAWKLISFCALLIFLAAPIASAQQSSAAAKTEAGATLPSLTQAQIDNIIARFTAKETEFRRALNTYAFKRDALVQIIGMGGQVVGEYHRVSDFTFDDQGERYEKINFFPMPTFGGVTQEDLEDLGGVNPFALEGSRINLYNLKYVGKERIDELNLYVFDVVPKVTPDPKKAKERFFIGRIWVDDHDLQIVKSKGKAIPETKINKFPIVESYREQIDGKYWFPTYAYADDDLIFDSGESMRIRMQVKYTDYKVGRGTVRITELEEVKPETSQTQNKSDNRPRPVGPVESGELNDKAIDLPKPIYPGEARKAKVRGQVKVRVIVAETGKVLSADIVSGPKQLWMAAIEAARQARFNPTLIGGSAVKITGILTYDFVEE
ncbi:MAG TPA: TonB family protein [Pyrinomonadaceae bacterium]|nr:TonB family protein [Pyrinomonadaceae bacterium]